MALWVWVTANICLNHCAGLASSHRYAAIKGLLGNLRRGFLLLDQEIADLRAVTVGDHYPVSGTDQRHGLTTCRVHVESLTLDTAGTTFGQNGNRQVL